MIGSVDSDTIQEMTPHDDDTRSAQYSEQGHNKEQWKKEEHYTNDN